MIRIVVCRGRDYALLYDRERQLDELVDPEPFRSNLKRDDAVERSLPCCGSLVNFRRDGQKGFSVLIFIF